MSILREMYGCKCPLRTVGGEIVHRSDCPMRVAEAEVRLRLEKQAKEGLWPWPKT